ncbi:MAG: hypothetical protein V2G43_02290 [bacterium JZ-2024 1]
MSKTLQWILIIGALLIIIALIWVFLTRKPVQVPEGLKPGSVTHSRMAKMEGFSPTKGFFTGIG